MKNVGKMEAEKLKEFNKELQALLTKYEVTLTIEDVPASKKIVITSIKKEEKEVKNEGLSEVEGTK